MNEKTKRNNISTLQRIEAVLVWAGWMRKNKPTRRESVQITDPETLDNTLDQT